MAVTTTTLLALQQEIARELGYASGLCSDAGSVTTIQDDSTDSPLDPDDDAELYKNSWAMIYNDTAGTPLNLGEVRRITSYNPSAQTFTLRTGFSNATTVTQSYAVFMGVPPAQFGSVKGILQYINDVLRETYYKTLWLLTEANDAGMETGGTFLSNGWTASTATGAYTTTLATGALLGARGISVTTSGVDGYVQQQIACRGSETWHIAVDCLNNASSQAKLVVTDNGTSATTDTITSTDSNQKVQTLWVQRSTTSDATLLTVRLQVAESGGVAYFDNLSIRRAEQSRIALPSWVIDTGWVESLEFWTPGSSPAANVGNVDDRLIGRPIQWKVVPDYTGATAFRVDYWPPVPRADTHLIMRAVRPFAALAASNSGANANQDTTSCNADLLKARVLARIYADKGDKEKAARWGAEAQGLARAYDAMAGKTQELQLKGTF